MERDPVRQKVRDLLWERGLNVRMTSLAIGRNASYLHGFLERGLPKVLSHQDAEKLAGVLGCETQELHRAERPPRRKGAGPKKRRSVLSDQGLASIPEVDVEVSAGSGALAEELVAERGRWFLPEGMIRHEGDASPDTICVLRVRGESMEPELSEDDRLPVDTARRVPVIGEMSVLRNGDGLVVKRVEHVHADGGAPALRLKSANPDYDDYTRRAEEVHIVGKVLWTVRRV